MVRDEWGGSWVGDGEMLAGATVCEMALWWWCGTSFSNTKKGFAKLISHKDAFGLIFFVSFTGIGDLRKGNEHRGLTIL